jgi:outer membrane receptor protein involved in Fe transport
MTLNKPVLLASTVIAGLTILTPTLAAAQSAQSGNQPNSVQEVVVTGSRIPRPNLNSPTPVETIDAKTIEMSGDVNIGDLIQQLPEAGVSALTPTNSNFLTRSNGETTVNLRNLGEARTLVLVNGRRYVAGQPGSQVVNFNSIPTEFIDHVDVVTGGASSVYGSDALAGVVNIITQKHYNGIEFFGQTGQTSYGDNINSRIGVKFGHDFAEGKGNFLGTLSYDKEGGVYARDRCDEQMCTDGLGGAFFGDNFHQTFSPFYSSFIPRGVALEPNGPGAGLSNRVDVNGVDTKYVGSQYGFNRQAYRALYVPLQNVKASFQANYEIAPWANFFMEGTYYHGHAENSIEPDPLGGNSIYRDANNVKSSPTCFAQGTGPNPGVTDPYYCTYGIPLTDANGARNPVVPLDIYNSILARNPGVSAQNLVTGFQRRLVDIGLRQNRIDTDLFRVVWGVNGDINPTTHYEFSMNFGRSQDQQFTSGQINIDRVRNSLNATTIAGQAVCADPVARAEGCVPFYVFQNSPNSAALAKYIGLSNTYQDYSQEVVVNAFVNGQLPWVLPAGPIQWVVGAEYRDEKSDDVPDPTIQTGLSDVNIANRTFGEFQVWEQFDELRVPLVKDMPLVKSLDLNLSGRWSHYTSVGNTTAWAASLEYQPNDWLKFRAQDARAVRAPNISELYSGANETFPTVTDPCAGLTTSGGNPAFFSNPSDPTSAKTQVNSNRAKACYGDPTLAARVARDGYFIPTQPELQGIDGFNSGNPKLGPETAKTLTFGFLFNPKWNKWTTPLSLSVDYYDIKIDNAISSYGRSTILDNCYGGPTYNPSNVFCSFVTRYDSVSPDVGAIRLLNSEQFNIATLETKGLDVQASYHVPIAQLPFMPHGADLGRLTFSSVYSHLFSYKNNTGAGSPTVDLAGYEGYSQDKMLFDVLYSRGPLDVSLRTNVVGPSCFFGTPCKDDYDGYIGWEAFTDMQVRYTVAKKYTLFVGIDNLFDNYVMIGQSQGQPTGWTTDPAVYDGLGRRFYAGFKLKL